MTTGDYGIIGEPYFDLDFSGCYTLPIQAEDGTEKR